MSSETGEFIITEDGLLDKTPVSAAMQETVEVMTEEPMEAEECRSLVLIY